MNHPINVDAPSNEMKPHFFHVPSPETVNSMSSNPEFLIASLPYSITVLNKISDTVEVAQ